MANVMTAETELEQDMLRSLRLLPEERRAQLHDFARFLLEQERKTKEPPPPRKSYMGVLSGLNINITEEDIAEARRDMVAGSLALLAERDAKGANAGAEGRERPAADTHGHAERKPA